MNKSHGVTILLLLLAGDLGLLRDSEACNTVSSIECVNSTYYLWCVDDGSGTPVTIGDPEECPETLVCDDTQANGCVSPDTVTTTESTSESTVASATTTVTTVTADNETDTTLATVTAIAITDSTATEESPSASDADFTCIYEGLYKAQDCSRFHVCYKFIWFTKHYFARCSEGLFWSSDQKRCVLQSLSDCP